MSQASETRDTLCFECPLTERTRTWLRLEEQFARARIWAARREAIDHRSALLGIFDIVDTATRSDIKSDLLQELDRQRNIWSSQLENPDVAQEALTEFLNDLDAVSQDLRTQYGRPGQALFRDHDWLNGIKQRAGSPGGASSFELPLLQSWMDHDESARRVSLKSWLDPLAPLEEAVLLLLRLLRESSPFTNESAARGHFQRSLSSQRPPMLGRVEVAQHLDVSPEVSANKYTANVRFFNIAKAFQSGGRTCVAADDIPFRLALCSL